MAQATHTFPKNFLWGTATAGYQVEGQSVNADFWPWEAGAGHIAQGQKSGRACDWWEGRRWQEDFDRAAADGHTAHRLSVEWSRIEPTPARWDEDALDHYRQMIKGLRARGLEPMVTLHHFANPLWVAERHVWETEESVTLFERYVCKVVKVLGADVKLWCTINEPNVCMYMGWVAGLFPPNKHNLSEAFKMARIILRAHAAAYRAIHELQPDARVGMPIHFRPIEPAQPNSALDAWVARSQFNFFSRLFPNAIRTGELRPLFGKPLLIPEVKGTLDYFALNYYTADVVRFDLTRPRELFGRRSFPPGAAGASLSPARRRPSSEGADAHHDGALGAAGASLSPARRRPSSEGADAHHDGALGAEVDDAKWYASYPPGFFWSLKWAHAFGLPIYVTENGIGDESDKLRPRYLLTHLRQLWRAVNFNWDVRGYFHWSLVDNFEWDRAWTHRFGLYALDPETQVRTPRRSAQLYAEICRSNSISSDLVARYAPELLETMFPG